MRKILLGILAMSTLAVANVNGEISVKGNLSTNKFSNTILGLDVEGNIKPHKNVLIEGKLDLRNQIGSDKSIFSPSEFVDEFKLTDQFNQAALLIVNGMRGKNALFLRENTFLRVTGLTNGYGKVALTQHGIDATSLSYESPSFNAKGFNLNGKLTYTADYNSEVKQDSVGDSLDLNKEVQRDFEQRGDIEAKLTYKINDEVKVGLDTGLGITNIYTDLQADVVKVKDGKLALDPSVKFNVEYKGKIGVNTKASIGYDKGIVLDAVADYTLDKKILKVKGLEIKPIVIVSASYQKEINEGNLVVIPKLSTKYEVYKGLSIVTETGAIVNSTFKRISNRNHTYRTEPTLHSAAPFLSLGLDYKF